MIKNTYRMSVVKSVHFCYTEVNPHHYKIPSSPADGQKLGEFEGKNFCP